MFSLAGEEVPHQQSIFVIYTDYRIAVIQHIFDWDVHGNPWLICTQTLHM